MWEELLMETGEMIRIEEFQSRDPRGVIACEGWRISRNERRRRGHICQDLGRDCSLSLTIGTAGATSFIRSGLGHDHKLIRYR